MNLFDQALLLLTAISAYIKNDSGANSVSEAIDLVTTLAAEGALTQQKLQAITNTVKAMVDEGREPTEEEWAALRARSDDAHAVIQNADLGDDDATDPPGGDSPAGNETAE